MASGTIKGITVEIGGDTTKLGKALEGSEKKSRSLQVELKQVEKMLKFDPTNVELLSQKQTILTQNIEETRKKLDTLKEAEKQVIAQFEKGEVAEDQVRALQREIIKTEGVLGSMKTEVDKTTKVLKDIADGTDTAEKHTKEYKESVEKAKQELTEFKDKASETFDTLKTGTTVLAGAVTATAGYALKLSTDFDQAFNQLVSQTGATEDEFNDLNSAMENVYKNNFGESMDDVARSMATVYNNTGLYGEELEKVTKNAIMLRDVFEFDVNESTRSAKMLMDQYGMSAEEAYNFIANGAQNGLDKNGDLLDTINEYAVHFKQLGLDSDDMFNMLVNGAESGTFSVDKLGDAVKEFGVRVKDGSKTTIEGFDAIGLDADEMAKKFGKGGESAKEALLQTTEALFALKDPIAQNTAGVNLFGTMWEDLGVDGVKALMDMSGGAVDSVNALERINNTKYDDIGSAIQGLGRTLQTDVIDPLGEELTPVVEDVIAVVQANGPKIKEILSTIVSKIGEFVGFIVDNSDAILATIAGIATGLLAWNVASIIMTVVGAIKSFITVVKGGTTVMKAFNMVTGMNPLALLVTAIVAVVVAITTFIATNEDARAKIVEIWNKIKEVVGNVIAGIVNFFTVTIPNAVNAMVVFFQGVPEKVRQALTNLVTIVSTIFNNVKNTVMTIAQNIYDSLPNGFQLMIQNVQRIITNMVNIFQNVFNIVKTVVQTAIDVIKAIFSGDFGSIPGIVSGALEKIKGFFSSIFDSIVTIVINVIASIINYWRGWVETIIKIFTSVGEKLSTWWNDLKTAFVTKVTEIINSVTTFFKELPGKIYTAIVGAIDNIKTWGTQLIQTAKTAISSLITNVVTLATGLPGKIYNAIKNAITTVKNWGSELISTGKTAISDMVTNMVNIAKGLPGKFLSIGRDIIEGIKSGISGAIGGLYESIKSGLSGLVNKAKEALGIHSPSRVFADVVGKQIPAGIAKGVIDNTELADKAVQDMTDDLTNQAVNLNGATINRKLATTFTVGSANLATDNTSLLSKLDNIYERLSRLQIVLDTGTLVGETIDKIDAGLANKQSLIARGV